MKSANPQARQQSEQSDTVRKQSHIPFIAKRGRLLAGDSFSHVLSSSAPGAWSDLVLEQHRCPPTELSKLAYRDHVLVFNAGRSLTCEYKHDGRWKSINKGSEALSLFPSGSQFDRRMQTTAHVLYLALDPMFFVRNAGDEMPTRPEFLEQRRESDPVLSNLARTLRAASDSDLRHDLLFGSAMALGLARHLLLRYSSDRTPAKMGIKYGMSRGTLKQAVDFMEAHLQHGLYRTLT